MASSVLLTPHGSRAVSRDELERIEAPPATRTWFPLKHSLVADTVERALTQGGYHIEQARYAVSRNDARLFATLDLSSSVARDVSLSVGVRNSTDQSFPLGFCAGNRVLVCDNLCFRAELLVKRKHTRFGQERFTEAICHAVQSLPSFQVAERERIERFQSFALSDTQAESLMLRSYEHGIISHRHLPHIVKEWRTPSFAAFLPRTLWSLLNAFTHALTQRQQSNPQQFAALTIRLQDLLGKQVDPVSDSMPASVA